MLPVDSEVADAAHLRRTTPWSSRPPVDLVMPPRTPAPRDHPARPAASRSRPRRRPRACRRSSPCFSAQPGVRRRAAPRPGRRRAVVRDRRSASSATCRASASTRPRRRCVWEAWDGDRLGRLRGRERRHRRPQPGRRRRRPRAAQPHRVGRRRPAGRVAAVPGGARRSRATRSTAPAPPSPRPSAFTLGGTVQAVHAETVAGEVLGLSEGVPGQVFRLGRGPVVVGRASRSRSRWPPARAGSAWQRGRLVRGLRRREPGLPRRPGDRRHQLRPGGPRARRHAAVLRRRTAQGRAAAGAALPRRRRTRRQRVGRRDPGAAVHRSRRSTGW